MKKQILDLDLRVGRGFSVLSDNPEEVRRSPGASRLCEIWLYHYGLSGEPLGQERRSLAGGGFIVKISRRVLRRNTVKEAVKVD